MFCLWKISKAPSTSSSHNFQNEGYFSITITRDICIMSRIRVWHYNLLHQKIFLETCLRGESHIDFCTKSVIMTLWGRWVWDLSLWCFDIQKKLSWIRMNCQWIVYSYTRVPSSFRPIVHIHRWTLWKKSSFCGHANIEQIKIGRTYVSDVQNLVSA